MQTKKRYFLLVVTFLFIVYCYFNEIGYYKSNEIFINNEYELLRSYIDDTDFELPELDISKEKDDSYINMDKEGAGPPNGNAKLCRMETCFDYNRCSKMNFKVYVYPRDKSSSDSLASTAIISPSYQKILTVLEESRYITADPNEACLFILAIDTLDRDPLSSDYVRNVPARIQRLTLWNNGLNHIIFNLYSGTWPDYKEDHLGFDPGLAILAKASISMSSFRHGFDVSIPLFHKKHPQRGGETGAIQNNKFPDDKKYLLAFKGKRYLNGIGSETRNALFHLHNNKDIIMLTTCRHGNNWKELKDERCDIDNVEYDKYSYEILLKNSTFCLVPRGRRLGSFRFLEVLQTGCIPVILSNAWALPFSQVIDWTKASIIADERLLLQVEDIVRSISHTDILVLKQQTQLLWWRYFSSIEKIIFTTLEIIKDRLPDSNTSRNRLIWNSNPGGLLTLPDYSDSLIDYPFFLNDMKLESTLTNFTAVVYCQIGQPFTQTSTLYKLIKNLAKSQFLSHLILVWLNEKTAPPKVKWILNNGWNNFKVTILRIDQFTKRSISHRFYPHSVIESPAILSLDEDTLLNTDEIDFAFAVWKEFPDRIVGYPARSHYWDDAKSSWGYTSKWTNDYSIVLTGAAFYHNYYNVLYTEWLSPLLHKTVEQSQNCEDILMNFLISHVTRHPPIKVTQRKQYKDRNAGGPIGDSPWNDPDHFVQRQTCLNTFAAVFGYMPLLRSNLRLDPVLFKDLVAKKRKKYLQIESYA